jgi:hypothetical protein
MEVELETSFCNQFGVHDFTIPVRYSSPPMNGDYVHYMGVEYVIERRCFVGKFLKISCREV